jgi:hypothetical protein
MTARVEGLILSAVEGERAAREVLAQIADGSALPDALLLRLLDLQAEDRGGAYVPPTPRVRAFLRAVQKRLEASR